MFTFSGSSKHAHFIFITGLEPAILNICSLGIDIAGEAKYFLAILDKVEYLPSFPFHHTSGLISHQSTSMFSDFAL